MIITTYTLKQSVFTILAHVVFVVLAILWDAILQKKMPILYYLCNTTTIWTTTIR